LKQQIIRDSTRDLHVQINFELFDYLDKQVSFGLSHVLHKLHII